MEPFQEIASPEKRNQSIDCGEKIMEVSTASVNSPNSVAPSTEKPTTPSIFSNIVVGRFWLLRQFNNFVTRYRSSAPPMALSNLRHQYRLSDLLNWFMDELYRNDQRRVSAKDRLSQDQFRQRLEERWNFIVPTSIFLPPSQIVDILYESKPKIELKSLTKEAGNGKEAKNRKENPKEQNENQEIENDLDFRLDSDNDDYGVSVMTKYLEDIGYELVSETFKAAEMMDTDSSYGGLFDQTSTIKDLLIPKRELKTYYCRECKFTSTSIIQLHEHQRHPHKVKIWRCALCSQFKCRLIADLKEHYIKTHGFTSALIEDEAPTDKRMCLFCEKTFTTTHGRNRHMRRSCPMAREGELASDDQATTKCDGTDILKAELWMKTERQRPYWLSTMAKGETSVSSTPKSTLSSTLPAKEVASLVEGRSSQSSNDLNLTVKSKTPTFKVIQTVAPGSNAAIAAKRKLDELDETIESVIKKNKPQGANVSTIPKIISKLGSGVPTVDGSAKIIGFVGKVTPVCITSTPRGGINLLLPAKDTVERAIQRNSVNILEKSAITPIPAVPVTPQPVKSTLVPIIIKNILNTGDASAVSVVNESLNKSASSESSKLDEKNAGNLIKVSATSTMPGPRQRSLAKWLTPQETTKTISPIVQKSMDPNKTSSPAAQSPKLFACGYCDLKFYTSAAMERHCIKRHLPMVPHACRVDDCQSCLEKFNTDGVQVPDFMKNSDGAPSEGETGNMSDLAID